MALSITSKKVGAVATSKSGEKDFIFLLRFKPAGIYLLLLAHQDVINQ